MLDDNEHQGLDSFEATLKGTLDDGCRLYSGTWKTPKDVDDPRHFVIVEPHEGKTLVYWGTPVLQPPWMCWSGPESTASELRFRKTVSSA
jgi:hypothetical protein